MSQLYTVYKTTYIIDQRYYIGVHKTCDPNDKYLGSGTHLRAAMKLYGRKNFRKEILFIYNQEGPAYLKEGEIVTPELIASGKVFNVVPGGCRSPSWTAQRRQERKGKPQPNISKAKRAISPMVGEFLVSFGAASDDPNSIIYEPVKDLLTWAEANQFSESTVRYLMQTGNVAKQGPLRGVFIRTLCSARGIRPSTDFPLIPKFAECSDQACT